MKIYFNITIGFVTENSLWKRFSKMLKSYEFQNNKTKEIGLFLNNYKHAFLSLNISPWHLIFFSRLPEKVSTKEFITVIKETHNFIKQNNLHYSLNDTHAPLGFEVPILKSFFHWGADFKQSSPEVLKTLIECGFNFNTTFYNNVLDILDGYQSTCTLTQRKWNSKEALKVFQAIEPKLILSEENRKNLSL